MKRVHFNPLIHKFARTVLPLARQGVYDGSVNWPKCHMCLNENGSYQDMDSIELVDWNTKSVTILGKHHGQEDYYRVDFHHDVKPKERKTELACAMRSMSFFDSDYFFDDKLK